MKITRLDPYDRDEIERFVDFLMLLKGGWFTKATAYDMVYGDKPTCVFQPRPPAVRRFYSLLPAPWLVVKGMSCNHLTRTA